MSRKGLFMYVFILTIFSVVSCYSQETLMTEVDNKLLDTLIIYAKRNYPRVKFFEAKINIAKADLQKQKIGWLEPLTVSYVVQPNNGNTSNATNPILLNGYQFGVYVNVGALLERPAIIRHAKEELKTNYYEAEEYDKNIEAEVKKRYYNYVQQNVTLSLVSKRVLDVEALLQNIKVRYEKSELSFEEYSKMLKTTNETIQARLEIEANILIAIATIEELIGTNFIDLKKRYGTK